MKTTYQVRQGGTFNIFWCIELLNLHQTNINFKFVERTLRTFSCACFSCLLSSCILFVYSISYFLPWNRQNNQTLSFQIKCDENFWHWQGCIILHTPGLFFWPSFPHGQHMNMPKIWVFSLSFEFFPWVLRFSWALTIFLGSFSWF